MMRRKRRQTSCNECWTLRLEWSSARRSSSEAWRGFSTLSCIGSMYQCESCTSSMSWCIAVYMVKRRSTCWTSANQSLMSVTSQRHLRSAGRRLLNVPQQRRNTFCPAGFLCGWSVGEEFVAGLPERPAGSRDTFCNHIKTFLFAVYTDTYSALEVLRRCAI